MTSKWQEYKSFFPDTWLQGTMEIHLMYAEALRDRLSARPCRWESTALYTPWPCRLWSNLEFFFSTQTAMKGIPMPPWMFTHTHVSEAETLCVCLLSLSLLVGRCGKRWYVETRFCSELFPPADNKGLYEYRGL